MGQSERLYAGKTLLPGQWTVVAITRGGWEQGRGRAPMSTNFSHENSSG
ncbi:hypothetical protein MBOURGENBZM_12140 [Methanoculleus bourgensis]|nr:hypothetical protein MBOURGENBZM_12140 [Methanoculleus bourgensis]